MIVQVDKIQRFKLSESFLAQYAIKPVPWGYGALSYVVFKRTYARELSEGVTEEWWQTCRRVIEGMFTIQKAHCRQLGLLWDNRKAQNSAQEAYERMFCFKWTPPGRGLWMMGTEFVYERGGACLNNCGFISTQNIDKDIARPFCWQFGMSMYGVGVGFDTRGVGKIRIQEPKRSSEPHVVQDSREGWEDSLRVLLEAFAGKGTIPSEWDVSGVRKKGTPIKGFGGKASGPEPLVEMLRRVEELFLAAIGKLIDSELITDTMNLVGKCVVSGGVRRTAQIAFAEPDDINFMLLKQDAEKLMDYRWASNNSIFARIGMDYTDVARLAADNGEPGAAWLENMRAFGRMKDPANWKDYRVQGGNPCLEQSLESEELCCLVESYIAKHDDLEDYMRTLKFAYMYAKTVTLVPTHDQRTNAVMMRNRRIGCSMSGIVQSIGKLGLREHLNWCDKGYGYIQDLDRIYSEWLCIPRSIKTTSVKPSGTVSILAGATPGVHHDHSEYMIRRVRVNDSSPIWEQCRDAGYHVEDDSYSPNTKVIEFPVHAENMTRGEQDVTIWEQVNLAALHQEYWADNQVSCTVKFHPHEKGDIKRILEAYEHRLKGISFLPHSEHGYVQAPYEEISKETYETLLLGLSELDLSGSKHEVTDSFCDGGTCLLPVA